MLATCTRAICLRNQAKRLLYADIGISFAQEERLSDGQQHAQERGLESETAPQSDVVVEFRQPEEFGWLVVDYGSQFEYTWASF